MKLSAILGFTALLAVPLTTWGQDIEGTNSTSSGNDAKQKKARSKNGEFTIGMFGAHSMRLYDGDCEAPPPPHGFPTEELQAH